MNSLGSKGSSSLQFMHFMVKAMVWYFVSDSHKVMIYTHCCVTVSVVVEISLQSHKDGYTYTQPSAFLLKLCCANWCMQVRAIFWVCGVFVDKLATNMGTPRSDLLQVSEWNADWVKRWQSVGDVNALVLDATKTQHCKDATTNFGMWFLHITFTQSLYVG